MSRISLHDVRLPPNLLKDIGTDEMVKLNGDDGAFLEFFDGLDLDDVRWGIQGAGRGRRAVNRCVLSMMDL